MEGWIGQTRWERDLLLDSEPEGPALVSFDSPHSHLVFFMVAATDDSVLLILAPASVIEPKLT